MEGSSHRVTPEGVRDGDPEALRGLVDRRGGAVVAFCEAVCDPEAAVLASGEAFARFRAAVAAWDDPAGLNPEVLLLGATRHAAASLARTAPAPRQSRGRFGRPPAPALCAEVPRLLAARADGVLAPTELDELNAHLDEHPACAQVEAAFRRAERAYRSPPAGALPVATADALVAALAGAAPVSAFDEPHEDDQEEHWPASAEDQHEPHGSDLWSEDEYDEEPEALLEPEPEPEAPPQPEPQPEPGPLVTAERRADAAATVEPDHVALAVAVPRSTRATGDHARGIARRARTDSWLVHADHGPVYRYLLPGAAIMAALIIILAIAGVFGGDGPAPGLLLPLAR